MDEMYQAIQAQTTPVVKMWVNWMMLVFSCAFVFAWKHTAARIVLIVFGLTLLLSLLIYQITNEPHLIGLGHILLWTPLAGYLILRVVNNERYKAATPFGIWIILLICTSVISLVLDVRDIGLVFTGRK